MTKKITIIGCPVGCGKTAHLMVDLIASLMGQKVFDRPNQSH